MVKAMPFFMASEGEGYGESNGEGEGLARMKTPIKIISKIILDIVKTQAYIG